MQRLKERCRWGKEVLEADVRALRARSKFICQELARNNAELMIHGGTSRCGVEELEASVRALGARFRATYRSLARKEARLKQIDAARLAHRCCQTRSPKLARMVTSTPSASTILGSSRGARMRRGILGTSTV